MPIGGDLSHNKCDNCNSFLVWNEFGNSHSDVSQLEEVCEECEVNKIESRAKIGTKVHNFLEKLKQKEEEKEECEKHKFMCDNCGSGFTRDEVVVTDDSSLCKTLCN